MSVSAIASGPGCVVLTTVNHLNRKVVELTLAAADGTRETVRPTAFHKFYSESRGQWISAQDLKPQERLRGIARPLQVVSVRPVPGVHRVYNMTVEGEHVYHVSTLGVLAHNTKCAIEAWENEGGALRHNQQSLRLLRERYARQGFMRKAKLKGELYSAKNKFLYENRKLSVKEYIARYRKGRIKEVLPKEAMDMSVEEALRAGSVGSKNVNVRKLLLDMRDKFVK